MVEQITYIGIGFLIAGLLVIGVIPLVHARAVRLTMRRLEALTPLSIAEIQADKDQLRAEFAMTMSRLEMSVEQMKAKTTNQLADLSRKSEAIGRLKLELGEKTAALFALEAKEKQLSDDLQTTQTELVQVTANFNDASVASGSQRVDLVALRAQTEALKGQIDSYEKETKALWDHLNTKTAELEAANQQLAEERSRADNLANRVGEFDRQLTAQTAESEVLGGRVQELAARLDEQGQLPADREGHSQNL